MKKNCSKYIILLILVIIYSLVGEDGFAMDYDRQDVEMTQSILTGQIVANYDNIMFNFGTGILIEEKQVLTAAHNVYSRDLESYPTTISFLIGVTGEQEFKYSVTSDAKFVFLPKEYEDNDSDDDVVKNYDIALLLLNESKDLKEVAETYGTFSLKESDHSDFSCAIRGYPTNPTMNNNPTQITLGGRIINRSSHRLYYDVSPNTTYGFSGAGIIHTADLDKKRVPYCVGIHSYGNPSSGTRLNAENLQLIRLWKEKMNKFEEYEARSYKRTQNGNSLGVYKIKPY